MQFLLNEYELRQLVQEAAGRATVPFMKAHPTLVMPSEELLQGCDELLKENFGINPEPLGGAAVEESIQKGVVTSG